MKVRLLLVSAALMLAACDQKGSPDSTKERARAEEDAGRESEEQVLSQRAQKMEAELKGLHHYYGALEGSFIADFSMRGRSYKLQLVYQRTIPAFEGGRVRQLSEIEAEKNSLALRVTANQWEEVNNRIVEGSNVQCEATQVKFQNLESGKLTAVAACKFSSNTYTVMFSEEGVAVAELEQRAKDLADRVKKKELSKVDTLAGEVRYASQPSNPIRFTARRTN